MRAERAEAPREGKVERDGEDDEDKKEGGKRRAEGDAPQ